MYKVLIVDDEHLICEGMKAMIELLDFKEIGEIMTAHDVFEAEKIIVGFKPDIVITDIRMEGLTGLDLIRDLLEQNSATKFIIISGYGEFQYARDAIKLGVLDYLLKPASMEEVGNAIRNTIQYIKKQEKQEFNKENNEIMQKKDNTQSKLNKLLSNNNAPDYVTKNILESLQSIFRQKYFHICLMRLIGDISAESLQPFIDTIETGLAKSHREEENIESFIFCNNNNDIIFFTNCSKSTQYNTIKERLKTLDCTLAEEKNIKAIYSLSDIRENIDNVPMLYKQAEKNLAYRIFDLDKKFFENNEYITRDGSFEDFDVQLEKLSNYIKMYRNSDANKIIDEVFSKDKLCNKSIDCIQRLFENILWRSNSLLNMTNANNNGTPNLPFSSYTTLVDIKITLKNVINTTIDNLKLFSQEASLINSVTKYIRQNYYKDITMSLVANEISMDYFYFSKFFKTQTGMNFSDYLLKVRMEEAIKILGKTNDKIHEVAKKVGYDYPKNFTRAFKYYFGISPKEYMNEKCCINY